MSDPRTANPAQTIARTAQHPPNDLLDFPSEHPERPRRRRILTALRSSVAAAFGCGLVLGGMAVWSTSNAADEHAVADHGSPSQPREPVYVSLGQDAVAVATAGVRVARPAVRKAVFRGSLFVQSRPAGAQVFLNGRAAGRTPLLLKNQTVGSRAVRVVLDGYDSWTSVAQIVTGRQLRMQAQLQARPPQ
jgi:hypothetical protein